MTRDETFVPLKIALPWSVLAQGNHRLVAARGRKGLTLAPRYREAKFAAELVARSQCNTAFDVPVAVSIAFFEPDRRKRDPSNLQKLIEDALSGIAYEDDSLIHDMHWWRAGIDKRDPRAEITIAPLLTSAGD